MQTLPLGLGLVISSIIAYAFPQLIFGIDSIWSRFFGTIFFLIVNFFALAIFIRNFFKAKSPNLLDRFFQSIKVISYLTLFVLFCGIFLIYLDNRPETSDRGPISIFGSIVASFGLAQGYLIYNFLKRRRDLSNQTPERKSTALLAILLIIGAFPLVLGAFIMFSFTYNLISSFFGPPFLFSDPNARYSTYVPKRAVSIAISTPGCKILSCIVATKEFVPFGVVAFDSNDKIQPSTPYDVYVCEPRCGTNVYLPMWDGKRCISTKDATLTLNVPGASCY